jgi:curved DNA-binding protein CbpA
MKNRRNYYRILQVQPDAPNEVIHASYRAMMRDLKKHPDLGGSTYEAAILNEAFEVLGDPEKRADYDMELFLKFTKQMNSRTLSPIAPIICPVCRRPLSRRPEAGEMCSTCRTPLQSDEAPLSLPSNKRLLERVKSSELVEFYDSWPGKPRKGKMIDFSPKGLRFLSAERLAPRTVLKISSRLFEASGAVTNVSQEGTEEKPLYAVGICFLAVHFTDTRGTFLSTSA